MFANQPVPKHELLACSVSLLLLSLLWGCNNTAAPPDPAAATVNTSAALPGSLPAEELLENMHGVYRNAKSYTDNATVVFYAVLRTTGGEFVTPFTRSSVAFERPNKLHVTYQKNISSPQEERYEVVSNGVTVRSAADELPLQIHEAIAPLALSAENFLPEPELRSKVLENAIENTLPQLALLLVGDAEQTIFSGELQAHTLVDAELDGKTYHRLALPSPAGSRVLWIDQDRFFLRRMEIPIDDQKDLFNARNQYSKIAVWIDFEGVMVDPEIESATFDLAIPENARRVRRFIPPPPAGPADLLGKRVGAFSFTTLEGETVTPDTLAGKVIALDFWSTNCPPCKTQTPIMNEVYEHFKDSEDVAFLAVSTDKGFVANEVVAKTLLSWGGEMPIVRDLKFTGYRELNVRQTPTLVLIDRESRLQTLQIGAHLRSEPVIDAMRRLVEGEDIVAADREKHAEYVAKYEQALDAAEIVDSIVEVETTRPKASPRKLPENLQLEQLWQTSAEQVERPGDIKIDGNHLLVLDGGEAIVELDMPGTVVGRHPLPQHDEHTNGFLRGWNSAKGDRWILASGVGWQQVYVFDNNWDMVLAFPDQQHSGIGDVLFDDLTGSGTPVMHVGYWGGLGVQGGTLDGRRLWTNRIVDHVLQLGVGPSAPGDKSAVASGGRIAWCSSTRGTLLQLGADGKAIRELYVEGQALQYFASQPNGENHCGLSVGKIGHYTSVGFDSSGLVTWEYPLPQGEYAEQLPRIQSVVMPNGEKAWLVVAADGSIHWLSVTGELIDRFDYGEILTGVVMQSLGDQALLFVATTENLSAWQINPPSQPATETE